MDYEYEDTNELKIRNDTDSMDAIGEFINSLDYDDLVSALMACCDRLSRPPYEMDDHAVDIRDLENPMNDRDGIEILNMIVERCKGVILFANCAYSGGWFPLGDEMADKYRKQYHGEEKQ